MSYFRLKAISTTILCLCLSILAACSGQTSSPAAQPPAQPPAQGTTAPNVDNKPREIKEITISEPTRTISYAPVYVAITKGFFEQEGVKVTLVSGGGGAQVLATLVSGDVQMATAPTISYFTLLEKNRDLVAIASINKGMSLQTVMSNQFLEKKGVTQDSPLADKIEALKGATLGAIVLGSAQEIYAKYNMILGGLTQNDVTVTVIGDPAANLVAMKEGVIDGTIFGAPLARTAEARGIGKLYIEGFEFPEYENMDSQWVFGTRKWIESNPEATKAVANALRKGMAFIMDQPAEAAVAIQPFFDGTDIKALEQGILDMMYLFEGDGSMTEESMTKALKPLHELSNITKITENYDMKENVFWTNSYFSK